MNHDNALYISNYYIIITQITQIKIPRNVVDDFVT
jgi:hypothetical protein